MLYGNEHLNRLSYLIVSSLITMARLLICCRLRSEIRRFPFREIIMVSKGQLAQNGTTTSQSAFSMTTRSLKWNTIRFNYFINMPQRKPFFPYTVHSILDQILCIFPKLVTKCCFPIPKGQVWGSEYQLP